MTPIGAHWPGRTWRLDVGGGTHLTGRHAGTGPATIVLLHGGGSNHRWWTPVARILADAYQVIWWDQRGHGRSDAATSDRPCTIDRLADDTAAVLDRLAAGPVVVVGHSAGAAVALRLAAHTDPGRVAALGCVEGGLYPPRQLFGHTWARARTVMLTARRGRVTEPVLRAWATATGLPAQVLPALLANYIAGEDGTLQPRLPADQEEQLAHSLWCQHPAALLPHVRAPVLAVVADTGRHQDTQLRRDTLRHARSLLTGPLTEEWIPGGHHLPLQQPDRLAAAITTLNGSPHVQLAR